jgi:mycothiol system anti-sigma-R factor
MAEHDHPHTSSGCEEALAELYTFLDGELTADKRAAIAEHLEGCNPCVEIFDFEAELRMVISRRCAEPVPEGLRLRISQTLLSLSTTEAGDADGDGEAGRRRP